MNKNNQLFLGSLLALSLTSLSAHAANINTVFSWETADYDTPANYSGYRLDININPTKSNWYFDAGLRQREADNNSRYQRLDLQAGYRYKINNGWIQPSFKVRQDITSYDNGNRLTVDFYSTKTSYYYNLSNNWALAGSGMFSIEKKEDLKKGLTTNTDYLSWEFEPGIRYFITPKINTTLAYYQSGKHANKQNDFDTREIQRNQQVRLYLSWNTPIGLVISPSTRQSVFSEITERNALGDVIKKDMSRYTLQLAYPINNQWRLMTEYYHEKIKTKDSDKKTEYDYFKVAVRASF